MVKMVSFMLCLFYHKNETSLGTKAKKAEFQGFSLANRKVYLIALDWLLWAVTESFSLEN
jgi:hypothetical protein